MALALLQREPQNGDLSSPNSSCLTRAAPEHLKTRMGKQSSHSRGSSTAEEASLTWNV